MREAAAHPPRDTPPTLPSLSADDDSSCTQSSEETATAAFEYLQALHFRRCDRSTPIVVHTWTNAGLGNAIGQLLLSLQFAALHDRTLVLGTRDNNASHSWVWTNNTDLQPSDIFWPSSCDRHLHEGGLKWNKDMTFAVHMHGIHCPTYGCTWANAVPERLQRSLYPKRLCVSSWYSHLLSFILRPSEGAMQRLVDAASPACPAELCGVASGQPLEHRGSWQAARAREFRVRQEHERPLVERGGVAWRPGFALHLATRLNLLPAATSRTRVMALHLRVGDACAKNRPRWQRPGCVYNDAVGWVAGWEATLRNWTRDVSRRGGTAGGVGGRGDVVVLLSTDSARAYAERHDIAASLGARSVVGFAFARAKYGHGHTDDRHGNATSVGAARRGMQLQFVENRLASGSLHALPLLLEGLLDLGLLAQGSTLVGSLYSNFARLAMQLAPPHNSRPLQRATAAVVAPPRVLSFDAAWCPYHQCNAGCTDVDRMCDSPREIAAVELSRGPRGGFEWTGVRPRRLPPPTPEGLLNETVAARRPWVKLMLLLQQKLRERELPDRAPRSKFEAVSARNACYEAVSETASALATMPYLY